MIFRVFLVLLFLCWVSAVHSESCGSSCSLSSQCTGSCSLCEQSRCVYPGHMNQCGNSCLFDSNCTWADDGCGICDPNRNYTCVSGCGLLCSTDAQCSFAGQGCTFCVDHLCAPARKPLFSAGEVSAFSIAVFLVFVFLTQGCSRYCLAPITQDEINFPNHHDTCLQTWKEFCGCGVRPLHCEPTLFKIIFVVSAIPALVVGLAMGFTVCCR